MMQPLYKMEYEYRELFRFLTDEEVLFETVLNTLEGLGRANQEEFLLNISSLFLNIRAQAEVVETAKKRMAARERFLNDRMVRLKEFLLNKMLTNEISEVSCDEFKISTGLGNEAVDIDDITTIPDHFFRITREPDKVAIKKAIKDNNFVPGAHLIRRPMLRIV